jgi:hypothetical protein
MVDLVSWNAQHLDRYADALARGLHDDDCEQRERSSLCHCSKRRRELNGKTEPPQIEFTYPVCTGCRQEVEGDGDSFACPRCCVSWSARASDGDRGEFNDDYGPAVDPGERCGRRLVDLVTEGVPRD